MGQIRVRVSLSYPMLRLGSLFFPFVFFPPFLDRYKSIFVKLLDVSFLLERFTRSNGDVFDALIPFGWLGQRVCSCCMDWLVCQNKKALTPVYLRICIYSYFGLLLDCWLNRVLSLSSICWSLSTKWTSYRRNCLNYCPSTKNFGSNGRIPCHSIVQALKSSVTDGPKIRPGDNTALLALSDKIENCCWAMTDLQSCELDCTTNLRHICLRLFGLILIIIILKMIRESIITIDFNEFTTIYPPRPSCFKAAKYEIQKPSTCRATLFRGKFLSMFPVFHLARSTWPATKTFVAGWRKVFRKVARWFTLSNKLWLCFSFFIELTTCHATNAAILDPHKANQPTSTLHFFNPQQICCATG